MRRAMNAQFETIEIQLPVIDSTDQQRLHDIVVAISSGHCLPGIADLNPGKLSHAS